MKLYFARPNEPTGAMDEPCATTGAAGAGFADGFWAGLCAKAGESGPAPSSAARKMASIDLAERDRRRLLFAKNTHRVSFATKRSEWTVPQRVVMMIFLCLEILSQWDVFISTRNVERALNRYCYIYLADCLPRGRNAPGAWL